MIKTEEMEKLPEGWKRVRFKDYVYFQEGPGLTSDLFEGKEEGIPFLNIRCIQENRILKEKLQYIDEKIVGKHFRHFLLEENDLVVSSSGTLGRCIFIKKENLPLLLNTSIIRMRPLNHALDRMYLKYYIESEYFQKGIYRLSTGSAQSNYGPSHLKKIYIFLPPLPEQQKIAEILETVDNVIEKTDAIIEKYKRIKQGLMQDLLTRGIIENYELGIMNYGSELRKHESGIMNNELGVGSHESEIGNWELRDERKHKFKDSPLGKIPEEWEVVSLEEVALPNGIVRGPFGGMLKKEIFVSRGYKVYEQGNAIYKSVNLGHYSIDAKKYKQMLRFAVKPKDFIISCSGTIGKIFMIPDNFKKGIINQALLKITIDNKKFNHKFFEYFFEWERFQDKIIDYTQGGAMPNLIGINEFKKVSFPKPPLPEQRRIASILSQVDEVIEKEQKYKEKLERIKWGLMEDLLTGRIRVNSLIEHGYIENGK
jgi:type I restriction enzyme S subunit